MNFYFDAIGTRQEVLGQLQNAQTHGNVLAENIQAALMEALKAEPDIHQSGFEDRYSIHVNGHSGEAGTPLTLSVTIQSRWMPKGDSG